tara:strand:- start:18 stop:266 length:249 start_codon:yes stop_codon:yes gene_type:complete
MKEELTRLDKKQSDLIDEEVQLQYSTLDQVETLIEADFDSDTIKTKIISSMKSLNQVQSEIWKIRDRIDFLKKCKEEGYSRI